ncbi:MAG: hypothetical protein KDD69_06995 [Bdellovibrionales bacterium]|nr:hypothetical protein [Bdellovibrionales bacterium]
MRFFFRNHYHSSIMRLQNSHHLSFEFHPNGTLYRLTHQQVLLNLFPGNAVEAGPTNLYLRCELDGTTEVAPLLGPQSSSRYYVASDHRLLAYGTALGIEYQLILELAAAARCWFWHFEARNVTGEARPFDLTYTQDVGLADYGLIRLNEHYVSQYVDHQPLHHPQGGVLLASRQNLSMGGRHPWLLIGSMTKAVSFATDGKQLYGGGRLQQSAEVYLTGDLPGERLQHEHSMTMLRTERVLLGPNETTQLGFFGWFEPDHAERTSDADLALRDRALGLPEARPTSEPPPSQLKKVPPSLFTRAPLLHGRQLTPSELAEMCGAERHLAEHDDQEQLMSFFTPDGEHVVLQQKERAVLRPHGMILRTGSNDTPDETALTSTAWMSGVFNAMFTQGHVSINRFLSTTHSYLGMFRAHGQRIFVELEGSWHQLGTPSVFSMRLSQCRWLYKVNETTIEVRNRANLGDNCFVLTVTVLSGAECRFLITHHSALHGDDGIASESVRFERDASGVRLLAPENSDIGRRFPGGGFRIDFDAGTVEAVSGDELLFEDANTQQQPFFCLLGKPGRTLELTLRGMLLPPQPTADAPSVESYWQERTLELRYIAPQGSPLAARVEELEAILPWFIQNAYIHYLSPRGLEQYSGGGWGTRDVVQGPLEMLLPLGKEPAVRDLLLRVFRQQNPDGDWPQWFMFFERERSIRPGDSHGDIVFWPLLAVGEYLLQSQDKSLLEEEIPFYHPDGDAAAERASLLTHIERALALITARCVPDTALISYGHGDWNDSLQPYDESLKKELVSTWTVTLHYQMLRTLGEAFSEVGLDATAHSLSGQAAAVLEDFRRHLLVDGVLTGFLRTGSKQSYLLHPRDADTGIHYSILAYIHAILSDMITREEAEHHLAIIREHLLGLDGARLFDQPLQYRGGLQKQFQRAESSSFFGREIGLMYTHAHLRYAQALAHIGDADGFFHALSQANPLSVRSLVRNAALRQSNCYYSSSDASFRDRYEAYEQYNRVRSGKVAFEGGWRVYSSGGGIYVGLVLHTLLGVREQRGRLVVDPVLPKDLDGLLVTRTWRGHSLELSYHITQRGYGLERLELNGQPFSFTEEVNHYRQGGGSLPLQDFGAALKPGVNRLSIFVG